MWARVLRWPAMRPTVFIRSQAKGSISASRMPPHWPNVFLNTRGWVSMLEMQKACESTSDGVVSIPSRSPAATDGLNRLFSNDFAPLRVLRDVGLGVVDAIGPLRRVFMRNAGGDLGKLPRLMRGEPA